MYLSYSRSTIPNPWNPIWDEDSNQNGSANRWEAWTYFQWISDASEANNLIDLLSKLLMSLAFFWANTLNEKLHCWSLSIGGWPTHTGWVSTSPSMARPPTLSRGPPTIPHRPHQPSAGSNKDAIDSYPSSLHVCRPCRIYIINIDNDTTFDIL